MRKLLRCIVLLRPTRACGSAMTAAMMVHGVSWDCGRGLAIAVPARPAPIKMWTGLLCWAHFEKFRGFGMLCVSPAGLAAAPIKSG